MIGGSRTAEPRRAQGMRAAVALVCARRVALPPLCIGSASAREAPHRRFLLLCSEDDNLAANVAATAGVVATFDRALAANHAIYAEFRDDPRFTGAEEDRRFAERLKRRYRGQHFDAILPFFISLRWRPSDRARVSRVRACLMACAKVIPDFELLAVDDAGRRRAWDPRGVGQSTQARCFQDARQEAALIGGLGAFPVSLEDERSWRDAYAAFAKARAETAPEILAHLSTTDTARDLEQPCIAAGDALLNHWGSLMARS